MQHVDFKGGVDRKYDEAVDDTAQKDRLKLRGAIARELFEAEPQEVKLRIRKESMEAHEEQLEKWTEAEDGLPSIDEEDQAE